MTAAYKSLDRFSEYEFTVFEKSDCFSNILRPVRLRRRLCFVFRRTVCARIFLLLYDFINSIDLSPRDLYNTVI